MDIQQPWEQEPDRLEFEHDGMMCLILRMPEMGGLCGYVGLPPGHPAYGLDYDKIDEKYHIAVHGGLTLAGEGDGDLRPSGYWWVCFDCAHAGDLVPGLYRISPGQILYNEYRDIDYVIRETKALAEQLFLIKIMS